MKRFAMVAVMFAALVVTGASFVSTAQATDIAWVTKQVKWATATPDTEFVQGSADTTRTQVIDTSDWAFAELMGVTTSTSNFIGATVTFVANVTNLASDSLNYQIEKCYGGNCVRNNTLSGSAGSTAPLLSAVGGNFKVFQGAIMFDTDTPGPGNVWACPQFRLCVSGDQSGTTPKLSGVKCYITYPKRVLAGQ